MSALPVLGVTLQAAAVLGMLTALGRRWKHHLGGLLILVAFIYHGVSEIILAVFPGQDRVRALLPGGNVGSWAFIAGVAMCLFTAAYLIVLGDARRADTTWTGMPGFLDWRALAVLTLPLLLLTFNGHGYAPQAATSPTVPAQNYLSGGLANQFLLLMLPLTGFAIVCAYGRRALMPVLVGQSLLLVFTGSRFPAVAAGVLLLAACSRVGYTLRRRSTLVGGVLFLLLAATLSVSRATTGRDAFSSGAGLGERVGAVSDGARQLFTPVGRDAVESDTVYRFDGNTYPALVRRAQHAQTSLPGATVLGNDLALAVPHFLNPSKSTNLDQANEEQFTVDWYGLPGGVDYLPTLLGMLTALFGVGGMFVAVMLLGVAFAGVERWVREPRPGRFLLWFGLVDCVLTYEQGVQVYFIVFRGVLVLAVFAAVIGRVRRSRQTQALRSTAYAVRVRTNP